jgi:heme-degrading monooxygenase HmoA
MIRVVYRWHVPTERRAAFAAWWHEGTLRIRAERPGALGSTLLAPLDDDEHMVAIASWRTKDELEAFWASVAGDGFDGARLVSTEVYDEVDDLTVR